MNTKNRLLVGLFFLVSSIFLSSCEADKDYIDKAGQDNTIVKRITLQEAERSNLKLKEAVNKVRGLKINASSSEGQRIVYDTSSNLFFDDESGLYIINDGKVSYTFPIIKFDPNEKVENICFNLNDTGQYDVILVKYDFTKEEFYNLTEEQLSQKETSFTSVVKDGVSLEYYRVICIQVSHWVSFEADAPQDEGELVGHNGNDHTSGGHWITLSYTCTDIGNGGSGTVSTLPPISGPSNPVGGIGGTGPGTVTVIPTQPPSNYSGIITGTVISNPLDTSPTTVEALYEAFVNSMSPESYAIFSTHPQLSTYLVMNQCNDRSTQFVTWAISHLNGNSSSQESVSLINNLLNPQVNIPSLQDSASFSDSNIEYLEQNNFSSESVSYLQVVLNEIIQNSNTTNPAIDPNTVLVEPTQSTVISNLDNYFDCFDTTQNAVFTLYVEQPTPNSNEAWSGSPTDPDVGHTFISIKQGNIRRVIGLYPSGGVTPSNPAIAGAFHDNSAHHFDVSLSFVIDPTKLINVINYIKSQSSSIYNLNSNNCTDFGLATIRKAGVNMPSAYGSWGLGAGDNPGQLGQNVRSFPTPSGGVKNTTGGQSQSNMGGCN